MASFQLIYVRDATPADLHEADVHAPVSGGGPWVVAPTDSDTPLAVAAGLAARLKTQAVAVQHHSVMGWVRLDLYEGEQHVRTLDFAAGGGGWDKVEGEVQPWEGVLFDREFFDEDEWSDEDRTAIELRALQQGANLPTVTVDDLVAAMGLPDPWIVLQPTGSPLLRVNGRFMALAITLLGVVGVILVESWPDRLLNGAVVIVVMFGVLTLFFRRYGF